MSYAEPTNRDDVIDSRQIEARIDELEAERFTFASEVEDAQDAIDDLNADVLTRDTETTGELAEAISNAERQLQVARGALAAWSETDEGVELATLLAFKEELEPCCDDWRYGVTLVRDSYFKEYAQELADDIGAINKDASWPNDCIDWDKAARELQMDYTSGDFDGVTYWGR